MKSLTNQQSPVIGQSAFAERRGLSLLFSNLYEGVVSYLTAISLNSYAYVTALA